MERYVDREVHDHFFALLELQKMLILLDFFKSKYIPLKILIGLQTDGANARQYTGTDTKF